MMYLHIYRHHYWTFFINKNNFHLGVIVVNIQMHLRRQGFGVQCLVQGHFNNWPRTGGKQESTTNPGDRWRLPYKLSHSCPHSNNSKPMMCCNDVFEKHDLNIWHVWWHVCNGIPDTTSGGHPDELCNVFSFWWICFEARADLHFAVCVCVLRRKQIQL